MPGNASPGQTPHTLVHMAEQITVGQVAAADIQQLSSDPFGPGPEAVPDQWAKQSHTPCSFCEVPAPVALPIYP